MVEGNHYYDYGSGGRMGQTSTQELCRRFNVPYGGLAAWIRLTVYRSKGVTKFGAGHNLNILVNHGQSGGQTLGGAINKLENQAVVGWDGVDMFLSSHEHKLVHAVPQKIGVSQRGTMKLIERKMVVAKTGCFRKAYIPGATSDSYEEKALFRPQGRGWFECRANIYQKWDGKGGQFPERWEFYDFNS